MADILSTENKRSEADESVCLCLGYLGALSVSRWPRSCSASIFRLFLALPLTFATSTSSATAPGSTTLSLVRQGKTL